MSSLIAPLRLGNLVLPSNVWYSPLAGCSDFPFRQMVARYRPGLMFCEMVKMDALVRNDANTFHLLDYSGDMHPIGAQLCGSRSEVAGDAAVMIEELGFDVVDLNCGCPVDKVTKDGSGSGLLKNPERIGEILRAMVAAVRIPVTVKIRAGWDDGNINATEIVRVAEAAGAKAIAVHGRTRQQGYRGPANWDCVRACVQAAESIKVIGNGDVFDAEAALRMLEETGCDGVMASRGTMGQPWLADDIYRVARGEKVLPRGIEVCRQALLDHFEAMLAYLPPHKVVTGMRRVGCWYLKKSARTREFRMAISRAESLDMIRELIMTFPADIAAEPVSQQCSA